jgi:hypothetical protein
MTSERELGANRVIIGRAAPKRGRQERLAGIPVLTTATGDTLSARDKIATRLVRRGTRTGPYGVSMPRQAGWGCGLHRLILPDGKVDETSIIRHQFAHLKQIGNLPGAACPAQPSRPPEPARRRNVARTCDGERRFRSGFARLAIVRPPLRGAPGLCPRSASMRACFLFLGCENLSGPRGSRVFGTAKRVTVMHVHHG